MSGELPQGAGLSSSSSLVVASCYYFLHFFQCSPSKEEIAFACIESERLVQVLSGGMDQACIVLSEPSSLSFIDFYPELTRTGVPWGVAKSNMSDDDENEKFGFLVCHSLVTKRKAESQDYNVRVTGKYRTPPPSLPYMFLLFTECTLGCLLLQALLFPQQEQERGSFVSFPLSFSSLFVSLVPHPQRSVPILRERPLCCRVLRPRRTACRVRRGLL